MVLASLEKADTGGIGTTNPAAKLTAFFARQMERDDLRLLSCRRLNGGAVQENWRLAFESGREGQEVRHAFVLRTDARCSLPDSRPKSEEFALLKVAFNAGVLVPEPLWFCSDESVIGAPFVIMRELSGTAQGRAITALNQSDDGNPALVTALARQLAKIHEIKSLPLDLAFLHGDSLPPAAAEIARWRRELIELPGDWPALEWGLRWCENHVPPAPDQSCLVHGDFRSGNYLVDLENGELTGILDWEFASWGDPMSDLGWFCAACWRFVRPDLEAGGIAPRAAFYQAYEAASGHRPNPATVHFWEVLAHIRWAIIAVQQGLRFFAGGEESLDLALTGRLRPAQVQRQLLEMTAPENWQNRGQERTEAERPLSQPGKGYDMTDLDATRKLLASATALYRTELRPALPAAQMENARMLEEALTSVLADLEPTQQDERLSKKSQQNRSANDIRDGSKDGQAPTHLALLQAIAQEIGE